MVPTSLEQCAPLLASLTLGSLGIVSFASGRQETAWRLFALYCWLLAGATGMAFMAMRAPSDAEALIYARLAPGLAFLSFVLAILYVAEFNELRWATRVLGTELRFDFSAAGRSVPGALNQVWMNLLVNAKDALGGQSGTIRVSTDCEQDAVRIRVSDSGCGIPAADLHRVFDPGYATKGVGVGTGLGLAICYQIVQDHGGNIDIESSPGGGTTATVRLDRAMPQFSAAQ